jgi:hypothetical protein
VAGQYPAGALSALLALSPGGLSRGSGLGRLATTAASGAAEDTARSNPTDETRPLRLHSEEDVDALLLATAACRAAPETQGGDGSSTAGSKCSAAPETVDPLEAAAIEALAHAAGIALLPAAMPAAAPAAPLVADPPSRLSGGAACDELCELGSPVGVRGQGQTLTAVRSAAGGRLFPPSSGPQLGGDVNSLLLHEERQHEGDLAGTWLLRPEDLPPNRAVEQWLAEEPSPARPPLQLQPQPQGPQSEPPAAGANPHLPHPLPPLPRRHHHHPRYPDAARQEADAAPPSSHAAARAARAEGSRAYQTGLVAQSAAAAAGVDWERVDLGSLSLSELQEVLARARDSFAFDLPH